MTNHVVLVTPQDKALHKMEKLEAHKKGLLHRAISILLFNDKGEMLIQQRAENKYHWPYIWSNAVCSHPKWDETYQDAANRRLFEELGISTDLTEIFRFIYKAEDAITGLIEHELDTVFIGKYDNAIPFNKEEINAIRWVDKALLQKELKQNPEQYSFWFKIILDKAQKEYKIPMFK